MQADTSSGWMEIRASNGRLLFKFNPLKNLVELKANGILHLVDLDDQTVSERPAAPRQRCRRLQNVARTAY